MFPVFLEQSSALFLEHLCKAANATIKMMSLEIVDYIDTERKNVYGRN